MDGSLLRLTKDQWQSEYFCVRDGCLLRFKSNKSTKPRAKYTLSKCVLVPSVSETQFDLQPRNKATISLRADSRKVRKKWEKELAQHCKASDLDLDLDTKDSAAVVTDSNGTILAVNKLLSKMCGYSKDKLIRQNVSLLTPKSIAKKHDAMIRRYVDGGSKKLVGKPRRLRMRTACGEEIPVVLFLSELSCNGMLYFMAVVEHDDSNSMQLNLETMSSGAVIADDYGVIVSANSELADIFGYSVAELEGENVSHLMPPAMRRMHDTYLDRYRRGKGGKFLGKSRRVIAQHKDGSRIDALVSIGELFENGQRLVLATFLDARVAEDSGGSEDEYSASEDTSDSDLSEATHFSPNSIGSFSKSPPSVSPLLSNSSGNASPNGGRKAQSPFNSRGSSSSGSFYRTQENPRTVLASLGPEYAAAFQQVQSANAAVLLAELRRLHAQHAKMMAEASQSAAAGGAGGPADAPAAPKMDLSNLVIERRLARRGGSGCSVHSVLIEGWRCAMKELDISSTNQRSVEAFLKEVSLCEALPCHPNICRYLFHARAGDRIRLFMTQYDGTLCEYLDDLHHTCRQLSLREIVRFARDVLNGLAFLHSNHVMHRDLKCENVFVMFNGQNEVQSLAIGDFDSARIGPSHAATMVGTPGFTAPEILREEKYTYSADVWSFGMVLYELSALQRPYEGMSIMQMSRAMVEGPPAFPSDVRADLGPVEAMYKACTAMDPTQRATVKDLQQMLATMPVGV